MSTKKLFVVAGVFFALVVAVAPAIAACDLQHPEECTNEQLSALISGLLGSTTSTTTTTTTTTTGGAITGIPAGFQFTVNLRQTSTGNDVKYLQILLNSDAATRVAATGAGSPGNETTYFGPATKAAVIKFQNKYASEVLAPYGLTAGTGYFGVSSRTKANALLGTGTGGSYPTGCTSSTGYSTTTGLPCSGSGSTLPTGCTSSTGYSPTTGLPCSGTGQTPTGTGFGVTLATTNPASGTIIAGQSIANLLEVTLTNATSSEVKVTAIELTRLGISADGTLSNIYLFDGTTRLTDAGALSSKKVTFSSTSGVITIPANSSKTIAVKSDILAGTAGQTVGISVSGITASTTLSNTSLPISGNIHSVAAAGNLATVTFQNVLPGITTTDPMDAVRVWEATAVIGNRNVEFTRLMLKQINSIESSDIKNFKLLVDGTQVATADSIDANGYLTFTFTKTLTTGNRVIKVLADITGGSGRVAQFSLRNKADVEMKDSEYGVTIAATAGVPATTGTITINPGNLTVTKATDSPSGKVPNNTSGATLGKFTMKAYGEAIKVENLTVGFTYTDADAAETVTMRNGQVYVNGSAVDSNRTLLAAGTQFNTNFIVNAGETATVEIKADIYDNDGLGGSGFENNDTIKVKLIDANNGNGWKQVSYGTLDVPSSTTEASALIVGEGAMSLVKTSSYANQNVVVPQANYKIGSWQLIASSTEDLNISSFSIDVDEVTNATLNEDDLRDLYIVYGGITSSIKATATVAGQDNDWAVSYLLAKNQTITIDLYARILGGATPNDSFKTNLVVTATGSLSGVTALQNGNGADIDGQTIIAKNGAFVVTRDASTPVSSNVDDTGTVKTYSLKFDAQNDSYVIAEVYVTMTDATAISELNLKDGSTVVGTAYAGTGGLVSFTGMAIPVSANTYKILDVEATMSAVGYGAGTSGANLATDFTDAVVRVGATGEVGNTGSGAVTQSPAGDTAAGNAIYQYKAVPTISLVALPSTVLSAGEKTIAKFTVSTNGTGTIAWKKIRINVTKTATPTFAANTVKIYDSDTGLEVTAAESFSVGDCSGANTTCTIQLAIGTDGDDAVEELISGSKTYEVRVTVGGIPAANDYISTQIVSSAAGHVDNAIYTGATGTAATFIWSDVSQQSHSTATQDWINDNLIKTIPATTQTMQK